LFAERVVYSAKEDPESWGASCECEWLEADGKKWASVEKVEAVLAVEEEGVCNDEPSVSVVSSDASPSHASSSE
jgi:hypothetical protein